MILYTLACDDDHRFESWFASGAAFDDQSAAGLISCPVCGSRCVVKAIMAPAVVGARRNDTSADSPTVIEGDVMPPKEVALLDARQIEIRSLVKAFRDKVMAEAQDVGTRFPEEARRMHEGEIPTQQIHGQATPAEARALLEDGIAILPIPRLPGEFN